MTNWMQQREDERRGRAAQDAESDKPRRRVGEVFFSLIFPFF